MRKTKRFAVGSAIVVGAMGAGIAFAAWTTDGTGSGFAEATSAAALTTDSATTSAQLFPTGSGDLEITVNNPNGYDVEVTEVNNDDAIGAAISSGDAVCDASHGVTFDDTAGLSEIVPAGGSLTFTIAGAVHMSNASVDACQGEIFTIPVDIVGASYAAP